MSDYQTTVIREGLLFGEAPRWHDGRLWYSDFFRHGVFSINADGSDERREVTVDTQPSGLGWLADGSLLIVSMTTQTVLRYADGTLSDYADMSEYCTFWANDMVVSATGVAYVGNFGFDLDQFLRDLGTGEPSDHPPTPTNLVVIGATGSLLQAVPEMHFPNGSVITPDGTTLIVAETMANRLSAFDIAPDGTLSARRTFAQLDGVAADGICLDDEGQVWVANPLTNECVRVRDGGEITARVHTTQNSYACMLGGTSGTTLFVMTAPTSSRFEIDETSTPHGCVEVAQVAVAGAGRP